MSERPDYEVFLSFRGPDTRRHFADFLYTMLKDVEIGVFRDEEDLEKGTEINTQLKSAIIQSKISIPVISKEYGSSKSCLMELEQMVECMDNNNHIIIPIFYYVEPSDVRNCRGPFERAGRTKRGRDGGVLNHWKSALRRIGDLKGYHLHEKSDGYHGKVIKQIVREVELKLKKRDLIVPKHLVGVDHHVQEIMAKLKIDYRNGQAVKIGDTREKVLICGIPGVGKKVLAKCVYNKLNHLYDACSFLEKFQKEISDDNIVSVQNRLISHLHRGNAQKFDCSDEALKYIKSRLRKRKVLVLLDDVKDREQLTDLVGEPDWFGPGSTVIVTSRRDDILKNFNGVESYALRTMKQDEALRLFCQHAFGTDSPHEEFEELTRDIVAATGGLPLALEVVGSSLFRVKSKKAWREKLNALKVAPDEKVEAALGKSYTSLDYHQRQIFLDVACFFIGMDRRIPSYMWNDCNYSPSMSIQALHAMSLVEIGEDKELCMCGILKKFGQEIVKKENRKEPFNRSRVWDHDEALRLLTERLGTSKVEALALEFADRSEGNMSFESDIFDGLKNLRYLKLDQANIQGNFCGHFSYLKWLDWQGCPNSFDVQLPNPNLPKLVILDLSGSQVDKDWGGWELLKQARELKVLKLIGCVQLTATPEFPTSMELERLILEGCSNLAVIDPSFCNLTNLVSLNTKGCSLLCELPDLGPMRGLKELVIDGTSISQINFQEGSMMMLKTLSACDCKDLTDISNSIRYLKSLKYLALDGSEISTLPESIGSLEKLKTLSVKNCRSLSNLPDGIGKLRSLQFLDLSDTAIQKLPPSVKDLKDRKVLRIRGTSIQEFPEAVLNLDKVEEIDHQLAPRPPLRPPPRPAPQPEPIFTSSMSRWPLYEVFLSFRGPDTSKHFAEFLYTMLTDTGIHVFSNEVELKRGNDIYLQPIRPIEQRNISIPVISKEYGSSKSCLTELEQMVECEDKKNHIIIPIFYYVEPSDVRECKGPFERAFDEHKKHGIDDGVLNQWMSALRRIAHLEGYHLNEKSEGSHVEVIKQIVRDVEQKLKKRDLIVPEHLVGVNRHVQEIMAKLKVEYCYGKAVNIEDPRVKVLGIYSMAGVGKTVLAKCVYNQLNHLFDACSFIGDMAAKIANHGVLSVQNKLISDLHGGNAPEFDCSDPALIYIQKYFLTTKMLVLLDDVKDHEQLSALVGKLDWLGPGSRVILTSRRQDVLGNINGVESFFHEPMKQDEALKLFCKHAFQMDSPQEKFKNLSTDIVAATIRLPLALEAVGSSLFLVKSKEAWRETLNALKVAPQEKVKAAFKKSYNNLDDDQQHIFLDIACFFIGMDRRIPSYMWNDCNYSPSRSIEALQAMSLVEIGEDNELRMHQMLKTFGREIVKKENQFEPCKHSRLCDHEDALHVLRGRMGTEKVEALRLEFGDRSEGNISFECNQFDDLQNLRYLNLDRADIRGNFGDRLSSLRWLDWQGCPKIFDDHLTLNLPNLVILDLSGSQVDKDWGGWELLKQARKLKVLKLTGCVQLTATPEFPVSMELEMLILEGCSNLAVIDPSFRNLTKLVSLNMKGCSLLCELPNLGLMRGLKELVIDGTSISRINFQEGSMMMLKTLSACNCEVLTDISNSIWHLKSLKYLTLDGSEISTLPKSIGSLAKLKTLSLKSCWRLISLPKGIGKFRSLQFLDLSYTMIQKLPPSVKDLKAMKVLRMRGTSIQKFPKVILDLENLEEIDFSFCRSLKGRIDYDFGTLSSLAILKLSDTRISGLPASISCLSRFRELHILRCYDLQRLPELPYFVNVFSESVN